MLIGNERGCETSRRGPGDIDLDVITVKQVIEAARDPNGHVTGSLNEVFEISERIDENSIAPTCLLYTSRCV